MSKKTKWGVGGGIVLAIVLVGVLSAAKGRNKATEVRIENVERLVFTGRVTEQRILYSALDAYLRGYELVVPPDGVAHIHHNLAHAALQMMQRNMHADLTPAADVF